MKTEFNNNPLYQMWFRAAALAEQTTPSRNRYVDFLRAGAIVIVIAGHWLVVAPYVEGGKFVPADILSRLPWIQLLSWFFQVMPIFFIVGGYANGASWMAAKRRHQSYRAWLSGRLRRLVSPLVPLLIVWVGIVAVARLLGAPSDLIKPASQFALLPTWFLVVYIIVTALVPITYRLWIRFGLWSFWASVLGTVIVDLIFFTAGLKAIGLLNYLFIWAAIHQLGYGWRDGRLAGPRRGLHWAVGGLLILIGLVTFGPYPISMVTVPGEAVSNTMTPKLPLLALGVFQAGLLLCFEPLIRRWLENRHLWTMTVLVNGMIMTIYLWHITALTLITGLTLALSRIALTIPPGSAVWWMSRPIWLAILAGALVVFVAVFIRFEQPKGGSAIKTIGTGELIAGTVLVCVGLVFLVMGGVGAEGWPALRLGIALMPCAGAAILRANPLAGSIRLC